jgi:hypothetical protein
MARRANLAGDGRHQRPPRNGCWHHGAVRRQTGGAVSVLNGKITKATTDMSGWLTKDNGGCAEHTKVTSICNYARCVLNSVSAGRPISQLLGHESAISGLGDMMNKTRPRSEGDK